MEINKYKILVLTDLKENAHHVLQYAVNISEDIDADIELLHVKRATEIVETYSPLSAMRIISDVCIQTEKKMKNLSRPILKEKGIDVKTTFGYGNVKREIENCIKISQPDIIVLGKSQRKSFGFSRDNIVNFVKRKHDGVVLTAEESSNYNFDDILSLKHKLHGELMR